jgi:GT2 family glycosyltransferase
MDESNDTSPMALVVVTRDRASIFDRYVMPCLRHAGDLGVDVVVVDQSTGPAIRQLVEDLPWVRYLRSEPGLSRGRNAGVAATRAQITVFTDDDVEFGPEWLPRIRSLFKDPIVGVVCGRGLDSWGRPLSHRRAGTYRWPTSPFSLGHGFNMAFRRAALDDAGPFDERLGAGATIPSAEDTDMFYRVMRAGWAALCDDHITVRHHDWRNEVAQGAVYRNYGVGFAAQTVKHAREGDTTAIRIAAAHLVRHGGWIVRTLVRRDRRSLRFQCAWLRGVIAGLLNSRRSVDRLNHCAVGPVDGVTQASPRAH